MYTKRTFHALLTVFFLMHSILLSAAAPRSGEVIGSILFDIHSVFDTDLPKESRWIYRAADSIHIKTREAVIQRELLFAEGDPYVPALCLYAERDLLLRDRCHELIHKANPKVKMVGLDTLHFLLQAKPAEALREIQAFVKDLEVPA